MGSTPFLGTMNEIIKDFHGFKVIKVSNIEGFNEWLTGQTRPFVDDENPFDWAYYEDYLRFKDNLPIID